MRRVRGARSHVPARRLALIGCTGARDGPASARGAELVRPVPAGPRVGGVVRG